MTSTAEYAEAQRKQQLQLEQRRGSVYASVSSSQVSVDRVKFVVPRAMAIASDVVNEQPSPVVVAPITMRIRR